MVAMHSVNRESMSFVSFKKFFNKILFNNFALKRKKKSQELLWRTQGQNQGGGWTWGREVGSAGVGWRDGEKRHTTVIE